MAELMLQVEFRAQAHEDEVGGEQGLLATSFLKLTPLSRGARV